MTYHRFNSKIGYITLYFHKSALVGLNYEGVAESGERVLRQLSEYLVTENPTEEKSPLAAAVQKWLEEYIEGDTKAFDLPLVMYGTPFQKKVWQELLRMDYGETLSYSELGSRICCTSARAVGTAVGKNTVPIIVPCHRILRRDGVIGKFGAGNGTESKIELLKIEGALPKDYPF